MTWARDCLQPWLLRAVRATLFWGVMTANAAVAQPDNTHLQLELGFGHETQTSPLFQISPDSTVIYQAGQQSLAGAHFRTNLQGSAEWRWREGVSSTVSAAISIKQAPQAPGMEMRSLAINPAVHLPLGRTSMGLGLDLQTIDVGGQAFRQIRGLQWDWTRHNGRTLWALIANVSQYRHPGELQELDAHATSLVMMGQLSDPLPGIDAIHLSAIAGREINANGYDDLSQHSRMLSLSVHGTLAGLHWTLGRSWRRATFDGTLFPGEPVREDQATMTDVGIAWSLSTRQHLRLEASHVHNASSTPLYDNRHVQYSLSLLTTF